MSDIEFPEGFVVSRKDTLPEYVLAKIWLKRGELKAWLDKQPEDSINLEVLRSKAGKVYAKVDDWKPEPKAEAKPKLNDDDIPF